MTQEMVRSRRTRIPSARRETQAARQRLLRRRELRHQDRDEHDVVDPEHDLHEGERRQPEEGVHARGTRPSRAHPTRRLGGSQSARRLTRSGAGRHHRRRRMYTDEWRQLERRSGCTIRTGQDWQAWRTGRGRPRAGGDAAPPPRAHPAEPRLRRGRGPTRAPPPLPGPRSSRPRRERTGRPGTYTIPQYVLDVLALLDALSGSRPCTSWGPRSAGSSGSHARRARRRHASARSALNDIGLRDRPARRRAGRGVRGRPSRSGSRTSPPPWPGRSSSIPGWPGFRPRPSPRRSAGRSGARPTASGASSSTRRSGARRDRRRRRPAPPARRGGRRSRPFGARSSSCGAPRATSSRRRPRPRWRRASRASARRRARRRPRADAHRAGRWSHWRLDAFYLPAPTAERAR